MRFLSFKTITGNYDKIFICDLLFAPFHRRVRDSGWGAPFVIAGKILWIIRWKQFCWEMLKASVKCEREAVKIIDAVYSYKSYALNINYSLLSAPSESAWERRRQPNSYLDGVVKILWQNIKTKAKIFLLSTFSLEILRFLKVFIAFLQFQKQGARLSSWLSHSRARNSSLRLIWVCAAGETSSERPQQAVGKANATWNLFIAQIFAKR